VQVSRKIEPAARVLLGIPPTRSDHWRRQNRWDRRMWVLEVAAMVVVVAAVVGVIVAEVLR
jgi:hypothetical protein